MTVQGFSIRGRACGNRACAAARPLGQVWRPWRCAAACRECNLAARVGCEAWAALGGLTCQVASAILWPRGPEEKRVTPNYNTLAKNGVATSALEPNDLKTDQSSPFLATVTATTRLARPPKLPMGAHAGPASFLLEKLE